MIRRCYITNISKDDVDYQFAQVEYMGKVVDVENIVPYGFCNNPPAESIGILFDVGSDDNQVSIFNKHKERFKNLLEWEVQIGNYKTKSSIKFEDSGNIVADAKAGGLILKNNNEELVSMIEELIIGVEAITTLTSIGTQPVINIATFTDLKTRIATLKG